MESVYESSQTSKELVLNEHRTVSEVERLEFNDGIKLHLKGCQFPQKSCPTPDAMVAINTVKRAIVAFINGHFIPTSKHKTIYAFNRMTMDVMHNHILKEKYMSKHSREIKKFAYNFLVGWGISENQAISTAKTVAHIFEYDNAYRYRLQDILRETTPAKLTSYRELKRLARILYERDDILSRKQNGDRRVGKQFLKGVGLAALALFLPGAKKALRYAIERCQWENFAMDDIDMYWSLYREDYNFMGLNYEERMVEYSKRGFIKPQYTTI